MNTKEMLKIALRRGHSCFLSECASPATYMFHDSAAHRMLYLCDEHTYITHNREQLPDADQIREIVAFINSGEVA